MITIVDYGSGNIEAFVNIYKRLNIPCEIASTPEQILKAEKLILPGVGAFDETMRILKDSGILNALNKQVLENKTPVIGICVGMQILSKRSDEGQLKGLGWVDAEVKKFDTAKLIQKPHLPHMGWNTFQHEKNNPLLKGLNPEKGFYFLHTYYFSCNNQEDVLTSTVYGERYTSAINHENIYGVQFHPEKSHSNGVQLLKNFANL
ncbi:MAG: imidazole glycerol phosphate synthase subunit HisH [Flavobacteriales bacterium]|nr:imidazole glycerol phosphate synthase subunit HisH [Flavobacteriales bacterium]|tara:strand:- start:105 stop:719 length:615 start_codon:yes stop_codon:yes gene_type:complete